MVAFGGQRQAFDDLLAHELSGIVVLAVVAADLGDVDLRQRPTQRGEGNGFVRHAVHAMQARVMMLDGAHGVAHQLQAIAHVAQRLAKPGLHPSDRLALRIVLIFVVGRNGLEVARLEQRPVVGEEVVLAPVDLELADGQADHRAHQGLPAGEGSGSRVGSTSLNWACGACTNTTASPCCGSADNTWRVSMPMALEFLSTAISRPIG